MAIFYQNIHSYVALSLDQHEHCSSVYAAGELGSALQLLRHHGTTSHQNYSACVLIKEVCRDIDFL